MSLFDVISESLLVLSQTISVILPVGFLFFLDPLIGTWHLLLDCTRSILRYCITLVS